MTHKTAETASREKLIPGIAISMGGQQWTVPPLTLGQLRHLMPKVRQLADIDTQMGEVQIGVLVEIVAAALQRNYPELTSEAVEHLLDLGNAGSVLNAVLTGSGLKPPGEEIAPGPGPGATLPASANAGSRFTASSLPPADTATR
jgi:hypothetical protein